MATQVQQRRGTTAEHSTFTGAVGEVTIDTDKDTAVVHDGSTAGGRPLLREDQSNLPTSAPANGVYLPSANNVAISTNGTGRLFVDSDGKVGVGTAPGRILHIDSGAVNNSYVRFTNNNATANGAEVGLFDNGTADPSLILANTMADGNVIMTAGGSERLRITSDGKLGLGTSSIRGTSLLDARGDISFGSNASYYGLLSYDAATGYMEATSSDGGFKWIRASGPVTSMTLDSSGRLGVGTTSPDGKLHVSEGVSGANASVNSDTLFLENNGQAGITIGTPNNTLGQIRFADPENDTAGRISYEHYNDAMAFTINNAERARIDSSGRLLVGTSSTSSESTILVQGNNNGSTLDGTLRFARGTSSPTADSSLGKLDFGDSGHTTAARIQVLRDGGTWTSGSSQPTRLTFSTTADGASSPTQAMILSQDKRFYLSNTWYNNITTANAANVHAISNGEFYRSTSSIKYKTDIETLQDSYADAILNVRPVWYRSTCQNDNPAHSWWGFIAEEVADVDPRLVQWKTVDVTYDENGSPVETPCDPEPEGVAYDRFVPHLLNLIKRQKEQIESQTTQLASFEARLAALEAQ